MMRHTPQCRVELAKEQGCRNKTPLESHFLYMCDVLSRCHAPLWDKRKVLSLSTNFGGKWTVSRNLTTQLFSHGAAPSVLVTAVLPPTIQRGLYVEPELNLCFINPHDVHNTSKREGLDRGDHAHLRDRKRIQFHAIAAARIYMGLILVIHFLWVDSPQMFFFPPSDPDRVVRQGCPLVGFLGTELQWKQLPRCFHLYCWLSLMLVFYFYILSLVTN